MNAGTHIKRETNKPKAPINSAIWVVLIEPYLAITDPARDVKVIAPVNAKAE